MPRHFLWLQLSQVAECTGPRRAALRKEFDPNAETALVLGRKAIFQDFHAGSQSGRYHLPNRPLEWNIYAEY